MCQNTFLFCSKLERELRQCLGSTALRCWVSVLDSSLQILKRSVDLNPQLGANTSWLRQVLLRASDLCVRPSLDDESEKFCLLLCTTKQNMSSLRWLFWCTKDLSDIPYLSAFQPSVGQSQLLPQMSGCVCWVQEVEIPTQTKVRRDIFARFGSRLSSQELLVMQTPEGKTLCVQALRAHVGNVSRTQALKRVHVYPSCLVFVITHSELFRKEDFRPNAKFLVLFPLSFGVSGQHVRECSPELLDRITLRKMRNQENDAQWGLKRGNAHLWIRPA